MFYDTFINMVKSPILAIKLVNIMIKLLCIAQDRIFSIVLIKLNTVYQIRVIFIKRNSLYSV